VLFIIRVILAFLIQSVITDEDSIAYLTASEANDSRHILIM
jgi:hypothetical protein